MTDEEFEEAQDKLVNALKLCVCGCPGDALDYILGGLEIIAEKAPPCAGEDPATHWKTWYAKLLAKRKAHYGSDGAEYFFYYVMDAYGMVEHGSSVPGWLSQTGEEILKDLRVWKEEYAKRNRE